MRRRSAACVTLALTTACTSTESLPFDLAGADGDLVVVATVDRSGEVSARVQRWGTGSAYVAAPEGTALHVWMIRSGAFVDARGVPLDAATLDGVEARAEAPGRCHGHTTTAPQVVYDGDACAIPPFAEHFAEPAMAPIPDVALVWPGESACEPHTNDVPRSVAWTLVDPDPTFWPHSVYAVAGDGTVAAFGEHHGIAFAPGGAASELTSDRAAFVGPVLAAAGLDDGRFLVSSENLAYPTRGELTVFDSNLAVVQPARDVEFRAESIHTLGTGDVLLVGEGDKDKQPTARLCDAALGRCADLHEAIREDVVGRALLDATILEDGALLAVGNDGLLVVERVPRPDEVTRATVTATAARIYGELVTSAGTLAWSAASKRFAGRFAGRERDFRLVRVRGLEGGGAVVCAVGVDSIVLVAPLARRHASSNPARLPIVAELPGMCSGISDAGSGALRVTTKQGASVIVDARGRVDVEDSTEYPGIGVPRYVETFPNGTTIAASAVGEIYERRGSDPFSPILAPAAPALGAPVEVFTIGGEAIALHQDGTVNVLGGEQRRLEVPADGAIVAATATDDGFLAAIRGPSGLQLRPSDGTRWLAPATSVDATDARSLAIVASGATVIADSSGGLFVHDDRGTRSIAIAWDDPTTTEPEIRPGQPSSCGFATGPGDVLRGVAAWGGTAWAVGCENTLLRVDVYAEPPTATRVAFAPKVGEVQSFTSVAATCPDELFVTSGYEGDEFDSLVWSHRVNCATEPCAVDANRFTAAPRANAASLRGAVRIARRGQRTLALHEDGVYFLGSEALFRMEDTPWRAGFEDDGTPWFVTRTGRTFRGAFE